MLALIPLVFAASDAGSDALPPMAWDWDQPQRLYIETEVRLPEFIWLEAEFNKQARTFGFQLRGVFTCQGSERETARKRQVLCTFDDVAIRAGAMPGDEGRLAPVLDEFDALMSEGVLALVMRTDGRVTDVNVDGIPAINFRTRARKEQIRLLSRYFAGAMEVTLPRSTVDATWFTNQALLCSMPTMYGTVAPVEAIHQGTPDPSGEVQIVSQGRGVMAANNSNNRYTCAFESLATWDPEGGLQDRVWTMNGEPTASSPIAMGTAGYPYTQRGSLRRLAEGEQVDVGPTEEIDLGFDAPTAIQNAPSSSGDRFTE